MMNKENEITGPFIKKIESKKRNYRDFEGLNIKMRAISKSFVGFTSVCAVNPRVISKFISTYQSLTPAQKAALALEDKENN
ncbi:MAG: hypothetical protein G3M70_07215 [Candidatus Nitronauta litoralis]|uniref:Uncharacterized protein n=1 Tax=Candidatus Nitronauta litoralis TaxID=2705533 RepID=A0A7T0BVN1_9BACT|nr:MAG: hypothetical protein G3M70_07215 [Candidatus Nitronauta litoralis]